MTKLRVICPPAPPSKLLAKGDYKKRKRKEKIKNLRRSPTKLTFGCAPKNHKKKSKQKAQLSILRRKWAVVPQCLKKGHLF